MAQDKSNTMWGGRFETKPDAIMEKINVSIGFDKVLYTQDIAGSKAHAKMLAKQKILPQKDVDLILKGLDQVKEEIESGQFEFKTALEDIHMNIESRLKEIIGEDAGRLHTARSRNDQVATDFRLWVREACDTTEQNIGALQAALLDLAAEHADTIMPGFTHLQVAQPITFGHHLLAYVEMLGRDRGRFVDTRKRLNESPLGAAALAGTSFPINRDLTAKALGFDAPMANSLDAVSARDFACEFLSSASICSIHLSRLAEEIILWSTAQFNFVRIGDAFTTGSSIMPQKKNPDAAELIRAKAGRVIGNLSSLLIMMKGQPLAYNKDMQGDKEPVFEATDTLSLSLSAMAGMLRDVEVNKESMKESATFGFSTATDLADWLVRTLKLPFREAHHITGTLVKQAEDKDYGLEELTLAEMQAVEPRITQDLFSVLSVENSVASRTSFGGTAPVRVKESIAAARKKYL
ncbi:MAG: argininosuccinate lyase [Alphaproteobacteria bacterium]